MIVKKSFDKINFINQPLLVIDFYDAFHQRKEQVLIQLCPILAFAGFFEKQIGNGPNKYPHEFDCDG